MTGGGAAPGAAPCLALDIGATKVAAALVSSDGELARRELIAIGEDGDLFERVVALAQRVRVGDDDVVVGVGCAGPMRDRGAAVSPLNIPAWREFPLRARLAERLSCAVHVDGDARALALAEGRFGAARGVRNYLSVTVSTGIGGGLVMDGSLVDGASGNAGHVGHLVVEPDGRACACGSRGCLEAEASGLAIRAMTGREPRDADDATRDRSARLVGRALGSLAAVLDLTRCFVGGSVAFGFGESYFDAMRRGAREVARLSYVEDLRIEPSALGADGPLLGAAMVGWRAAT